MLSSHLHTFKHEQILNRLYRLLSLFSFIFSCAYNMMYLKKAPLIFSHHFMLADPFLTRIMRVFPFISASSFAASLVYSPLWYLICVHINACMHLHKSRAFNFFCACHCSSRSKKSRTIRNVDKKTKERKKKMFIVILREGLSLSEWWFSHFASNIGSHQGSEKENQL